MKNDLIQVDNKFYIKSKVVMLPTNKASKIHKLGKELGYTNEANNNPLSTQQNLYFLSDEIIPFGSYYYKNEDIYKYSVEKAPPGRGAMLVIATTDPELNKQIVSDGEYFDSNVKSGLPRPSNEFLQKYCELGGIDEVLIEVKIHTYGNIKDTKSDNLETYPYNERAVLKIAPDNTITIRPLEVKTSWTREEVEKLLYAFGSEMEGCSNIYPYKRYDKWIEENLK